MTARKISVAIRNHLETAETFLKEDSRASPAEARSPGAQIAHQIARLSPKDFEVRTFDYGALSNDKLLARPVDKPAPAA